MKSDINLVLPAPQPPQVNYTEAMKVIAVHECCGFKFIVHAAMPAGEAHLVEQTYNGLRVHKIILTDY